MLKVKGELADIKKENAELRLKNEDLNELVEDLRERMRNIEQYTRKNNLEISGIPVTPQEDVRHIVKDVGAALGCDMQVSQIAAAHRVPSYNKERPPAIIVNFYNRDTKEEILRKFREVRGKNHLTANTINKNFIPSRVYVSQENKQFLSKLKKSVRRSDMLLYGAEMESFLLEKLRGKE
ncbi:uncharacterized protein LOC120352976 [Nilaparvata lugens]|uniref:uncharacterized protein LOC120352976 n=1 Tax=Nilaparvata lugens TaxID=108931 RepID=UPI00193CEA50|nr:uncharacterized protein LOC120352976 [Nilaparvata lugens]